MSTASNKSGILDQTASDLIERYPELSAFFGKLGVDDCCLELDLRTIASHHGLDVAQLGKMVEKELESAPK